MKVVYLLHTQKKMGNLPEVDLEIVKRFVEKLKVCDTFDEVLRMVKPVETNFENLEVYMARINPKLKVIFTYKENAVYLLSLVDK